MACKDEPSTPSSSALLALCNLPTPSSVEERRCRLKRIRSWCSQHPDSMSQLLESPEHRDRKTGCMPLHWLAGTGFDEAIECILTFAAECNLSLSADQHAEHPSTHRTPLHYAARNGHLSTCQLLVEKYGASPHPQCGRGSVTPLQLAVWQNRLEIVRWLVQTNGENVVHERNGFDCGLMHWIGLVPEKRWGGSDRSGENDGSGVLPLARYLHSLGISYESTSQNSNTQGHTPNHKAAWGGNLPLIQYFRDEHGVYDVIQDEAGNYAADIAKMRGNMHCHKWLLEHGNGDRAESYKVLGLPCGTDMETVRARYFELARIHHPDKVHDGGDEKKEELVDDFVKIKAAYEHLTKEGGIGKQRNPKFELQKLLEDHQRMSGTDVSENETGDANDDMFIARLMAVISDYGDDGFPVSLVGRRWNQIWPDRPFPTEFVIERTVKCSKKDGGESGTMVLRKKVKLLKWLKWRCKNTKVYFRNTEGDVLAFDGSKQSQNAGC